MPNRTDCILLVSVMGGPAGDRAVLAAKYAEIFRLLARIRAESAETHRGVVAGGVAALSAAGVAFRSSLLEVEAACDALLGALGRMQARAGQIDPIRLLGLHAGAICRVGSAQLLWTDRPHPFAGVACRLVGVGG
jgi:hypothetical protein